MTHHTIHSFVLSITAVMMMVHFAEAHDRTTSYSSWQLSEGKASVVLTMSDVDLKNMSLPKGSFLDSNFELAQYAAQNLVMMTGDQPCSVSDGPYKMDAPTGRTRIRWSVTCPDQKELTIHSDLFFDTYPGHLHFASISNNNNSAEQVLSRAERSWPLGNGTPVSGAAVPSTGIGTFWTLGIKHIATGYDHLAFLLALVLLGGTLTSLVKIVSGFTVGHSVTLALATLGLVKPEIGSVEALIAVSIVLVAVENIWLLGRRSYCLPAFIVTLFLVVSILAGCGWGRMSGISYLGMAIFLSCYYPLVRQNPHVESARWATAMIFGLIHGLAFASVLREANLPTNRLTGALLGFNLGVEVGQIVIVAIVWPMLSKALSYWGTIVTELGSAVVLGLGFYWLTIRTYM